MDIVTITWSGDAVLQCLQSYSINRFVHPVCTHWVIIEDNNLPLYKWHGMLSPFYTTHTLKLQSLSSLIMNDEFTLGWHRQQFLKFYIAKYITSTTYLILDSKNFFIKPFDIHNIQNYDGNGRLYMYKNEPGNEKWSEWMDYIHKISNLPIPDLFWAVETPFVVNTNLAIQIVNDDWYTNMIIFTKTNVHLSEFILYRFYSNSSTNTMPRLSATFWPGNLHFGISDITSDIEPDNICVLTLHKEFIKSMPQTWREDVYNLLLNEYNFPKKLLIPYLGYNE